MQRGRHIEQKDDSRVGIGVLRLREVSKSLKVEVKQVLDEQGQSWQ